jgi:hypothetical protein
MAWRPGEVWFDVDVLWFREQPRSLGALAVAGGAIDLPRFDTGLEASRRRRFAAESARKHRFATRTVPRRKNSESPTSCRRRASGRRFAHSDLRACSRLNAAVSSHGMLPGAMRTGWLRRA